MSAPEIVKADGTREAFKPEKLVASLERSGAEPHIAQEITDHVSAEVTDGMSTRDIYRHARKELTSYHTTAAAKYSLRRALFNLGPTGFPFEDFLARLYAADGYTTHTGTTLSGACVEHEVDLVAHKGDVCLIAEAKFHGSPGLRSDIQVALYSHARFQDILNNPDREFATCSDTQAYIFTNTKFTDRAQAYAECVGVQLVSWNYPNENTLQDRIERAGIYPLTTLPGLSTKHKRALLERGVILCADLPHHRDTLKSLGLSDKKAEAVIAEGMALCNS